jgi:hypothetical protein
MEVSVGTDLVNVVLDRATDAEMLSKLPISLDLGSLLSGIDVHSAIPDDLTSAVAHCLGRPAPVQLSRLEFAEIVERCSSPTVTFEAAPYLDAPLDSSGSVRPRLVFPGIALDPGFTGDMLDIIDWLAPNMLDPRSLKVNATASVGLTIDVEIGSDGGASVSYALLDDSVAEVSVGVQGALNVFTLAGLESQVRGAILNALESGDFDLTNTLGTLRLPPGGFGVVAGNRSYPRARSAPVDELAAPGWHRWYQTLTYRLGGSRSNRLDFGVKAEMFDTPVCRCLPRGWMYAVIQQVEAVDCPTRIGLPVDEDGDALADFMLNGSPPYECDPVLSCDNLGVHAVESAPGENQFDICDCGGSRGVAAVVPVCNP